MRKLPRVFVTLLLAASAAFAAFWYSRPEELGFEAYRALVPHAEARRFAEVGGVRLHFQEKGSGPALVLIHGNNSSAYYLPLTTRAGQRAARLVRQQRHMVRVEQMLGRVKQPALLIWGAEDRLILLEDGRRLQASLGDARLVVFDDCGHLPQEEMPERFAREVLAFAARFKNPM